jgi:hypothetical protein
MENNEIQDQGRNVQEMVDTPGWKLIDGKIESQIRYNEDEADKLQEDTLKLLEDGNSLESIQARSIALRERAGGLKIVRNIINQVLSDKEAAENRIRENK